MEHTDLEKYKLIVEPSLFRNRPAPIAMEDKKNDLEQKDVQQKISNAEMKNEQTIDYSSTMISNLTKIGFQTRQLPQSEYVTLTTKVESESQFEFKQKLKKPLPLCESKRLGKLGDL